VLESEYGDVVQQVLDQEQQGTCSPALFPRMNHERQKWRWTTSLFHARLGSGKDLTVKGCNIKSRQIE
jgi:hypothetical protein